MIKRKKPLVSIFCLAYNHEAFIKKAIESWLMQKTNFEFEAVIGEDNSTDRTREIVFSYAEKYPNIIRVVTSESNVGMKKNSKRTLAVCNGKYIAFCEGDDYWINPNKLQMQVDFMETNPEFSICFHDAIIVWDDKSKPLKYFVPKNQKIVSKTEDVIEKYYIPTASMLVRSKYIKQLPDWFEHVYNGDWGIQLILSTKGNIKYIDEIMSVYLKNKGGLSGGIGKNVEFVNNKQIELLLNFNEYSNKMYDSLIKKRIIELKKSIKDDKCRRKSKLFYWGMHPKRLIKKHFSKT